MTKTAYLQCSKCGAQIPSDDFLLNSHENIAIIRYDPNSTKKIILVNSESGSRREVDLGSEENPNLKSRHIAGIISPY